MQRYFFHLNDAKDQTGADLPSLADAKRQAVRYTAELLSETADQFWETGELTMIVSDEHGLVLFSLGLAGNDWPVDRHLT